MARRARRTTFFTMERFRFQVTVHCDDIVAVHALRGIAYYAQETLTKMSAVGGATEKNWDANGHNITFQFTSPRYRERFLQESERLLAGRWNKIAEHDERA
jgi:hypothetical protein